MPLQLSSPLILTSILNFRDMEAEQVDLMTSSLTRLIPIAGRRWRFSLPKSRDVERIMESLSVMQVEYISSADTMVRPGSMIFGACERMFARHPFFGHGLFVSLDIS